MQQRLWQRGKGQARVRLTVRREGLRRKLVMGARGSKQRVVGQERVATEAGARGSAAFRRQTREKGLAAAAVVIGEKQMVGEG